MQSSSSTKSVKETSVTEDNNVMTLGNGVGRLPLTIIAIQKIL